MRFPAHESQSRMDNLRISEVKIFVSPPEDEKPITSANDNSRNTPENSEDTPGSLTPEDASDGDGRKLRSRSMPNLYEVCFFYKWRGITRRRYSSTFNEWNQKLTNPQSLKSIHNGFNERKTSVLEDSFLLEQNSCSRSKSF